MGARLGAISITRRRKHAAANICSYVGETQGWTYVKGDESESCYAGADGTDGEEQVALAMRQGAMGLSTSLLMPPSNLITTGQLIELAKGRAPVRWKSTRRTCATKAREFFVP